MALHAFILAHLKHSKVFNRKAAEQRRCGTPCAIGDACTDMKSKNKVESRFIVACFYQLWFPRKMEKKNNCHRFGHHEAAQPRRDHVPKAMGNSSDCGVTCTKSHGPHPNTCWVFFLLNACGVSLTLQCARGGGNGLNGEQSLDRGQEGGAERESERGGPHNSPECFCAKED